MRYIVLNKIIVLIFLLIVTNSGISQTYFLKAKIIDNKTKQPITGVIILNLSNQKNATYTNEEGMFNLLVAKNDSLKITCVGYKDSIMRYSENLLSSTIELSPNFILLSEVVLNNTPKGLSYTLGNIGTHYDTYHQGGTKGSIKLVFVPNMDSSKSKIITKLKYQLRAIYRDIDKVNKGLVRVRLYSSEDAAIFPKSNLLQENIIKTVPLKDKQTLIIDISKYKINFPNNGVFVGLEWLGEQNNSNEINLNPSVVATKSKGDPFNFISFYGKPFVHIGKMLNSYYTSMFGIEVEEYLLK